jgi:mevalonate kinase
MNTVKVIYIDDGLDRSYDNPDEIIISWWGIDDFTKKMIDEVETLMRNDIDSKLYFNNLNEVMKRKTSLYWPQITILER